MEFFYRITITCFFASYLVALLVEISRMFRRSKAQTILLVVFAIAGIFAQTSFLAVRFADSLGEGVSFGNWQMWCVLLGWVLAIFYLWFEWRKKEADIGLFLLPMVLILVAAAYWLDQGSGFSNAISKSVWGPIHGFALLLGTVGVVIGSVFGIMYLIQAYRLKAKKLRSKLFKLPSLEWLQKANERSLIFSSVMLGFGLVSGIVLNIVNQSISKKSDLQSITTIEWSEPVVWSSLILFAWIVTALCFNWFYKPARHGRKVAYLVLASFTFLVVELVIVLATQHASETQTKQMGSIDRVKNQPSQFDEVRP